MISYRDVVVSYPRSRQPAVNGVSFDAEVARVTAVVGPNGSGKSTLVRALLSPRYISAGSIHVAGRDRRLIAQRTLARTIAVVPQREEPAFPMPVREYVALGRLPHLGRWGRDEGAGLAPIEKAVARADVQALLDRSTDELSGGEWQRVRVARALAQDARALVLDEPTTFLDIGHEMALFELVASLAQAGLTVLVVSHQLNLVARFAHTMVLLDRGQIAAAGPPESVMDARILEAVYGWPLVVTRDAASAAPALVPLRRQPERP